MILTLAWILREVWNVIAAIFFVLNKLSPIKWTYLIAWYDFIILLLISPSTKYICQNVDKTTPALERFETHFAVIQN